MDEGSFLIFDFAFLIEIVFRQKNEKSGKLGGSKLKSW